MTPADRVVLDALHHHMTDVAYAHLVAEVEKAGSLLAVRDTTALIELAKAKRSFGGDRSAAGAYAASIRWGKKKNPEGGTSSTAGGDTEPAKSRYSSVFTEEKVLDEVETSTNRAYDKTGFGDEKGDALAVISGTRKTLYDARRSLEAGIPIETVRGGLMKEVRRLKSLATRTTKKGEELQVAEGGRKKDASGKLILTRSVRLFTDARIMKTMATVLEGTIRRLDGLRP